MFVDVKFRRPSSPSITDLVFVDVFDFAHDKKEILMDSCAYRDVRPSRALARVDHEGRRDHVGVEPLRAHGIQNLHRLAPLVTCTETYHRDRERGGLLVQGAGRQGGRGTEKGKVYDGCVSVVSEGRSAGYAAYGVRGAIHLSSRRRRQWRRTRHWVPRRTRCPPASAAPGTPVMAADVTKGVMSYDARLIVHMKFT